MQAPACHTVCKLLWHTLYLQAAVAHADGTSQAALRLQHTSIPADAAEASRQSDTDASSATQAEADARQSQAVSELVGRMLRANLTAEAASARLFAGQGAVGSQSDDIRLFKVVTYASQECASCSIASFYSPLCACHCQYHGKLQDQSASQLQHLISSSAKRLSSLDFALLFNEQ